MPRCPDCGGWFDEAGESCRARFDRLLALDHSRVEPWGSRHGLAFAAFALQHPSEFPESVDRSWAALYAIYVRGRAYDFVFRSIVAGKGAVPAEWKVPARPAVAVAAPAYTIADLNDFDAATYAVDIDRMCLAALGMWGATPGA